MYELEALGAYSATSRKWMNGALSNLQPRTYPQRERFEQNRRLNRGQRIDSRVARVKSSK
ncbi:MAG: hypothetical protein KC422_04225 [Trueperaceae bacterium]|nr:hypothetical protein [Trueperaceae bacterium]